MKALIVYGGWDGHDPKACAELFAETLQARGAEVTVSDTLDALSDVETLKGYDVIVPHWTMGELTDGDDRLKAVVEAVQSGVGIAGCHGGMGDSMRGSLNWQWMCGGQFVGHPYVGEYEVFLTETTNPLTANCPRSFSYNSEQYYMLVDPSVNVLAETVYDYEGQKIVHPVAWTKTWGKGNVFYLALGHQAQEFRDNPHVLEMLANGIEWAARKA